ncbi:MAG: peptide deformylase [Neomegalonema sp.]|nr:peptide deformylase [Neomegalonema sp.]
MTRRPILIHPDPRLRRTADPVETVNDATRALVDEMLETMYAAPGIGLAAPQIGVLQRVFVMDCSGRDAEEGEPEPPADPVALINPEIVWFSEETAVEREGCLSIPEMYEDVTRPAKIRIRYLDRDGGEQEQEWEGIRAVCAQHELDHLNGKLFIDYLGSVKRTMITSKMKKLKRERAKDKAK